MPGHLMQFAHKTPAEQTAAWGAGNHREETLSMEKREIHPEKSALGLR